MIFADIFSEPLPNIGVFFCQIFCRFTGVWVLRDPNFRRNENNYENPFVNDLAGDHSTHVKNRVYLHKAAGFCRLRAVKL